MVACRRGDSSGGCGGRSLGSQGVSTPAVPPLPQSSQQKLPLIGQLVSLLLSSLRTFRQFLDSVTSA